MQRSLSIDLPSCEALSDPCTQDVIFEYTIQANGGANVYTVRFPQYKFVPDPHATYRDVKDGVAVYLTQGWVRTTIIPSVDVSVLTPSSVSFSTASPPVMFDAIAKMFSDASLGVTRMQFEPDNPQWYLSLTTGIGAMRMPRPTIYPPNSWRMLNRLDASVQQVAALGATLAQIRSRFGNQIEKTYECAAVPVDGPGSEATWSSAEDDANRQADQLAQITGGGGALACGIRSASPIVNVYAGRLDRGRPSGAVRFGRSLGQRIG
jgi:hypothetical protein